MGLSPLRPGDTIGIVSPSHIATPQKYEKIFETLRSYGFNICCGKNLYSTTDGYLASVQERADDFNDMVRNPAVRLVFFGGGDGGNELLPLLDYKAIRQNPKCYLSYSDGTSILNAIWMQAGVPTFYGQSPAFFANAAEYDYRHFKSQLISCNAERFEPCAGRQMICGGACSGRLLGGYTLNMALLVGSRFFRTDPNERYILILEDNEKFNTPLRVSALLSHIEQSQLMPQLCGMVFGHYSLAPPPELLDRLRRFGQAHRLPVLYCDDFGHGLCHGILPIGRRAHLDADALTLTYMNEA